MFQEPSFYYFLETVCLSSNKTRQGTKGGFYTYEEARTELDSELNILDTDKRYDSLYVVRSFVFSQED